jgi:phytoene dehydrogenase-like protein
MPVPNPSLSFGSDPRADAYDAVVVGGGIGGLSAGAFLASAGQRVLVVERSEAPGGFARAFRRGPYTFDPAVHIYGDGEPDGLPNAMHRYLGVEDMVEFLKPDTFYRAAYPGVAVDAPLGLDRFIDAHAELFPDEREGFDGFFRTCVQLHAEAHSQPPKVGLRNLDELRRTQPVLTRFGRATTSEGAAEFIRDPRARALACATWPYSGTPPHMGSLTTFSTVFGLLVNQNYYPGGSAQTLVDALAVAVTRNGGEIVVSREVTKLEVDGDHVAAAVLDHDTRIRTPVVVSAIAAQTMFERLIGLEHFPQSFVKRHRKMRPGLSAVMLYATTKADLREMGAAHENFMSPYLDSVEEYEAILRGEPGGTWVAVPTLADPSLAPAGEHAVTITSMAHYAAHDEWTSAAEVESFQQHLLDAVDLVLPCLSEKLDVVAVATPPAAIRFTGNSEGACYGWDNIPRQTGGRRSPRKPPLEGLYLAGHWTQPGGGTLRCLVSGYHTAQLILRAIGAGPIEFEHPTMPPFV